MSTFTQQISDQQNIGDSLPTITNNFTSLNDGLCNILNFLDRVKGAFDTRTIGLTSLVSSVKYSARFAETHEYNSSDSAISFNSKYGVGTNPIYRALNTTHYNVDINGTPKTTDVNNGYYTLNPTTGIVHIPQGIYTVDAECSAYYCLTHITNIIDADTGAILVNGTCEYCWNEGGPYSTTYSKMHGRITVSNPLGINIRLKQYLLARNTASLGWTYAHYGTMGAPGPATTPLLYWAFINIQKIQDYSS
jgi:hypothetical protein